MLGNSIVNIQAVDVDYKPNLVQNKNMFYYSQIYEVDYSDGMAETLYNSIIYEKLLDHFDEE